jgi:hypothetical protein
MSRRAVNRERDRQLKAYWAALATAAKQEERRCFGIAWFATEAEAQVFAQAVRALGRTYNGGFFHGAPCGRNPGFDHGGLFAVTH